MIEVGYGYSPPDLKKNKITKNQVKLLNGIQSISHFLAISGARYEHFQSLSLYIAIQKINKRPL